jgi:hypothetical protein
MAESMSWSIMLVDLNCSFYFVWNIYDMDHVGYILIGAIEENT